jgi:hypothetical protein
VSDDQFLHCRECDVVFRPSRYDRVAEFRLTADGYTETLRDDWAAFLTRHARHPLRALRIAGDVTAHAGPLSDPMSPRYWQVSDGDELFVVEGWRETVTEALRYRVRPGRLIEEFLAVEVSEEQIREQVDRALYPGVAPERRLAAFVEAFRTRAWALDPAAFEPVADVPRDPTLVLARLPRAAFAELAAATTRIFDPADAARITDCLEATDDPEAWTVLLRRRIRVAS